MAMTMKRVDRRARRGRAHQMSDINVTPFVDVMLVLLIVFMVTAPLLTVGVPVDLPKTKAQALGQDREPLSVTVKRNGEIYLQNQPVPEEQLIDKSVDYGRVMQVMAEISAAGFTHIGLVTDVQKPRDRE